jgi:AcrR family transcriptional regulator
MPAEVSQDTGWEFRRADARRNRARVIAAARDVFAERGLDATVDDVAARAGVGKGTVYRIFHHKEDLVAAVVSDRTQWMEQRSIAALTEPDPAAALNSLISDFFARLLADRVILGVLEPAAAHLPPGARERLMDNVGQLLEAAKPAGAVRGDVTIQDLAILMTGCAERLYADGITDPAAWQRYCEFILRAIRP